MKSKGRFTNKLFTLRSILPNNSSGFTLLEVMIAASILAVALVAALGSQSAAISWATRSKFETIASALAQAKMAEVEVEKADELQSGSGSFDEPFSDFYWRLEVNSLTIDGLETIEDSVKHIRLAILWGEGGPEYEVNQYKFFSDADSDADPDDETEVLSPEDDSGSNGSQPDDSL